MDQDQEQSDQGPHCLPVCKNKSARIFSRRHKQTTISDAVFLGALRVKISVHFFQQVHLVGLDIFTGKKYDDICPSTHNMEVPIVERKEYTVVV